MGGKLSECFVLARKDENKGKKHKGLIVVEPDLEVAKSFLLKAKRNIELCSFFKEKGFDYKLPEEWFYTLYYCALAILVVFGVESRSQRCTGLLLRFLKDKYLIDYEDELIDRIQVYNSKGKESYVDKREKGRYSSLIQMEEVLEEYEDMTVLCKRAITQCEEIVFSSEKFVLPEEILSILRG